MIYVFLKITQSRIEWIIIGLIYRLFHKAFPAALNQLYKSLVLPTLDYCSSLWDPHHTTHVDRLESVQRFAAKIVSKRWNTSEYDDILSRLKWERLSLRRKKQKIMLCHRILLGNSIIPLSTFTPHSSPHLRHTNSMPLFCPHVKTWAHLSSFMVSVIPLWNSLPQCIMSHFSTPSFKSRLKMSVIPFWWV